MKTSIFSNKTTGLINNMDLKKRRIKVLYWIMFLIMILVSLFCLLPVVWVALSSFKTPQEINAIPPTFFPEKIDFSAVTNVLTKYNFMKYVSNSVIIIIGCWAFDIILNGLAGYVLSRIKPLGSAVLETLIFWTMLLPGISMVPLYMSFVDVPIFHFNLAGSFIPMFLMTGANAYNIMLFRNFFDSIPMSYLESARIDGCSNISAFAKIIMPLSKPIIMVVSIFSITGSWGNFMWPYLLVGNTDKEPVAVMLYRLSTANIMENEYLMILMLSIIPMIVIYALFSKQIMGGVNMSGIKG